MSASASTTTPQDQQQLAAPANGAKKYTRTFKHRASKHFEKKVNAVTEEELEEYERIEDERKSNEKSAAEASVLQASTVAASTASDLPQKPTSPPPPPPPSSSTTTPPPPPSSSTSARKSLSRPSSPPPPPPTTTMEIISPVSPASAVQQTALSPSTSQIERAAPLSASTKTTIGDSAPSRADKGKAPMRQEQAYNGGGGDVVETKGTPGTVDGGASRSQPNAATPSPATQQDNGKARLTLPPASIGIPAKRQTRSVARRVAFEGDKIAEKHARKEQKSAAASLALEMSELAGGTAIPSTVIMVDTLLDENGQPVTASSKSEQTVYVELLKARHLQELADQKRRHDQAVQHLSAQLGQAHNEVQQLEDQVKSVVDRRDQEVDQLKSQLEHERHVRSEELAAHGRNVDLIKAQHSDDVAAEKTKLDALGVPHQKKLDSIAASNDELKTQHWEQLASNEAALSASRDDTAARGDELRNLKEQLDDVSRYLSDVESAYLSEQKSHQATTDSLSSQLEGVRESLAQLDVDHVIVSEKQESAEAKLELERARHSTTTLLLTQTRDRLAVLEADAKHNVELQREVEEERKGREEAEEKHQRLFDGINGVFEHNFDVVSNVEDIIERMQKVKNDNDRMSQAIEAASNVEEAQHKSDKEPVAADAGEDAAGSVAGSGATSTAPPTSYKSVGTETVDTTKSYVSVGTDAADLKSYSSVGTETVDITKSYTSVGTDTTDLMSYSDVGTDPVDLVSYTSVGTDTADLLAPSVSVGTSTADLLAPSVSVGTSTADLVCYTNVGTQTIAGGDMPTEQKEVGGFPWGLANLLMFLVFALLAAVAFTERGFWLEPNRLTHGLANDFILRGGYRLSMQREPVLAALETWLGLDGSLGG